MLSDCHTMPNAVNAVRGGYGLVMRALCAGEDYCVAVGAQTGLGLTSILGPPT